LAAIYAEWRVPFARCIAEAQLTGEIAARMPADELADFLLASWQGAIMRMKVDRTPAALERFKAIAFQTVFAASSAASPSSPTGLKPTKP
jgi:TetR/AcrR family transcriptional repressor of nem operon